ncbi:hypothetical protein, partial [Pseudomonas aeruginosa]|uniref:hypothetical protein n=1 Tax=Pseudomonas aeruginosa TaxID=287 RepID=UPI0031B69B11
STQGFEDVLECPDLAGRFDNDDFFHLATSLLHTWHIRVIALELLSTQHTWRYRRAQRGTITRAH